MRYRKGETVVNTFQVGSDPSKQPIWIAKAMHAKKAVVLPDGAMEINGTTRVEIGDWIVEDEMVHKYMGKISLCKNDEFEASYEKVE